MRDIWPFIQTETNDGLESSCWYAVQVVENAWKCNDRPSHGPGPAVTAGGPESETNTSAIINLNLNGIINDSDDTYAHYQIKNPLKRTFFSAPARPDGPGLEPSPGPESESFKSID